MEDLIIQQPSRSIVWTTAAALKLTLNRMRMGSRALRECLPLNYRSGRICVRRVTVVQPENQKANQRKGLKPEFELGPRTWTIEGSGSNMAREKMFQGASHSILRQTLEQKLELIQMADLPEAYNVTHDLYNVRSPRAHMYACTLYPSAFSLWA